MAVAEPPIFTGHRHGIALDAFDPCRGVAIFDFHARCTSALKPSVKRHAGVAVGVVYVHAARDTRDILTVDDVEARFIGALRWAEAIALPLVCRGCGHVKGIGHCVGMIRIV